MIKKLYQTTDGSTFDSEEKALAHESLLDVIANSTKISLCVKRIVATLNDFSLTFNTVEDIDGCKECLDTLAHYGMDFMCSIAKVYEHSFIITDDKMFGRINKTIDAWKTETTELRRV